MMNEPTRENFIKFANQIKENVECMNRMIDWLNANHESTTIIRYCKEQVEMSLRLWGPDACVDQNELCYCHQCGKAGPIHRRITLSALDGQDEPLETTRYFCEDCWTDVVMRVF